MLAAQKTETIAPTREADSGAEIGDIPTRGTILCVDDEPSILSALRRLLKRDRHEVVIANGGAEGLQILEQQAVDVIISDMRMPGMSGAEFLAQVAQTWPDTTRILLTGYADLESAVSAVNDGRIYRYISKPWSDEDLKLTVREAVESRWMKIERERLLALTRSQNEELSKLNSELESRVEQRTRQVKGAYASLKRNFRGTLEMFTHVLEMNANSETGHGRRVADLTQALGQACGVEQSAVEHLTNAALLHDLGKLALPSSLAATPYQQLDSDQRSAYEQHAEYGAAALSFLEPLAAAANIARHQYERFDGSGSPDQLESDQIPLRSANSCGCECVRRAPYWASHG